MSWLKKARGLKRISSRELGEMCGMSMNYIQKIEGGNRGMPSDTAEKIYAALGFTPDEVRFETPELLEQIEGLDTDVVSLSYVLVGDVIYFTGIDEQSTFTVSVDNARLLLASQSVLFG